MRQRATASIPIAGVVSRRALLCGGAAAGAVLLLDPKGVASQAMTDLQPGATAGVVPALTARSVTSKRHTTRYWTAGPVGGPLMIFVHGWPQSGLMWRAQMEAFAAGGWHCIAPDMRGYGASSAPSPSEAYALREMVEDMVELHEHLGAHPAIWIGHDLGSPVVGALAAHHATRCRGVVFVSVPYLPESFSLPSLLPLVDRSLYPADQYPDGQWDYYRFYLTHFDQTVADFDANIPATLAAIYRHGDPAAPGKVYRSALVTRNGGWFGAAHRAPDVPPDPMLWPAADFSSLIESFRARGFRPANAWYLNDDANLAYARAAPAGGRLRLPVLFVNGDYDGICDVSRGRLGEPMRRTCTDLSATTLPELVKVTVSCIETKRLSSMSLPGRFAEEQDEHAER
jgi:pimeloyl-ACP methyl ester carboxylesterase